MRIKSLVEFIAKLTNEMDREVDKGFNLNEFSDFMKFAHALQIQAQALIDIFQRAASLLGEPPQSYVEAGEVLLKHGLISREEFIFYKSLVGFRNILVHGYLTINLDIMEEILKNRRYREILELARKIMARINDP